MKLLLILLLVASLAACGSSRNDSGPTELDKYTQMCHDKGGAVSFLGATWTTVRYQCIGDTGELMPVFSAS